MRLAFSSSVRRAVLRFLPPRLMKYWIIRIPDPIPPGDTFLRAIVRAISVADPLNVPAGGCVESVVTSRTHFRFDPPRFVATVVRPLCVFDIEASPDAPCSRQKSGGSQHDHAAVLRDRQAPACRARSSIEAAVRTKIVRRINRFPQVVRSHRIFGFVSLLRLISEAGEVVIPKRRRQAVADDRQPCWNAHE